MLGSGKTGNNGAYATDKLAAHPEVLAEMRATGEGRLLTVHLMPQNICNQRCSFCSYRLPDNKNSFAFDESKAIPWDDMQRLLSDFEDMGVLGVEVTGGGEPLAYPKTKELWAEFARKPFATALVTNGTLLRGHAPLICDSGLKWARVSIDCSTPETYAKMRKAPEEHFDRAWRAVSELAKNRPDDPEFRLGVGFVLSNENYAEVFETARLAKEHGADNIRLSSTYSDANMGYFSDATPEDLAGAIEQSFLAVTDLEDETFTVKNLLPVRLLENEMPYQDYRRCPTKDLLCVVEGEGKVYTCCTFTGSLSGLYGKFHEHPGGFRGLWEDNRQKRLEWDSRESCKVSCLYRQRNLAMNQLIDGEESPQHQEHIHREFI